MSSRFNGFSADEINQIHSKRLPTDDKRVQMENAANNNCNHGQTDTERQIQRSNVTQNENEADATENEMHNALYFQPLNLEGQPKLDTIDLQTSNESPKDSGNDPVLARFRGISLKDFDEHRQIMEEANNEKKKILAKTIEQLYVFKLTNPRPPLQSYTRITYLLSLFSHLIID